MNQRRWKRMLAVTALGAACTLGRPALPADALRPDVAKPLAAAQELYRAHKYRDALGKIAQAAAVPNRTPYETYMVEEMRGAAAMAGKCANSSNAGCSVACISKILSSDGRKKPSPSESVDSARRRTASSGTSAPSTACRRSGGSGAVNLDAEDKPRLRNAN